MLLRLIRGYFDMVSGTAISFKKNNISAAVQLRLFRRFVF